MPNNLIDYIDKFIPKSIGDSSREIKQRCRIAIILSFVSSLAVFIATLGRLAIIQFIDFNTIFYLILSIIFFINPFLLYLTKNYKITSSLIPVLFGTTLPFAALKAGGFDAPIVFVFPSLFIITLLLMELEQAIIFVVLMSIEIIALFVFTQNNDPFPIVFKTRSNYRWVCFIALCFTCLSSIAISYLYEISRKEAEILDHKRLKELSEAHKIAQDASNAKSQFLANISHEIRTPLNGIIGSSELLINTNLNKDQQDFVETIRTNSNNLLIIINEILDFSKTESGKLELELTSFDLREILGQYIELFASQVADKKLQLNYVIDKNTSTFLMSDVMRLRQILINLIGNAIKFTSKGEIIVSISSTKKIDNIYEFHFQVKDTGIGIAPDQINKLFQPFNQVDASTTRRYGGKGLGLAISKRLAELLGGKMWVESEIGKGSTFHFTIVAKVIAEDEIQFIKSTRSKNIKIENIAKDFPLEILVAEDNLMNQKVTLKILKKMGYSADVASNGLEALNKLENKDYDVVLMDIQMPEMDGLTATRQICQRYSKESRPKIIAVTAGAMNAERQDCLDAGMDDFLTKPIDISKLQQALSNCRSVKQGTKQTRKLKENSEISIEALEDLEPALNYSKLEMLISLQDDDTPNLVAELIDTFTRDSKEKLNKLSDAVKENDLKIIQTIAHNLVSSSGNLGAEKLSNLSRRLEECAVKGQTNEIKSLFTQFLAEFERATLALKIEQEKISSKALESAQ